MDKVFGPGKATLGGRSACIASRGIGIFSLRTKNAVDPAVFMADETHIIYIGIRIFCLRHTNRIIPKAEAIDAVLTFSHGKE
jgi:hypothetical protein